MTSFYMKHNDKLFCFTTVTGFDVSLNLDFNWLDTALGFVVTCCLTGELFLKSIRTELG